MIGCVGMRCHVRLFDRMWYDVMSCDVISSCDNFLRHSALFCTVPYRIVQYVTVQYNTVQNCIYESIFFNLA